MNEIQWAIGVTAVVLIVLGFAAIVTAVAAARQGGGRHG